MADPARRLDHNVDGDLFVDASCIDCDTCRWMAPETFTRRAGQSSVHDQPADGEARRRALMALISCPTASIGTASKDGMKDAVAALPDPVTDDVYHCGYHHEASFGAASYLIVRDDGNVLVDSPRFAKPLVRNLEALGGVRWLFLTHQDDVADHDRWAAHFGCERILHADDLGPSTRDVERVLEGEDDVRLTDDLLLIPTPGHTRGSVCLLHDDRHLFTGDHIAWSANLDHVYAFRSACWYDWATLVRSAEKLLDHTFSWILPGHGRRCHFPPDRMRAEVARGIEWMR